MFLFFCFLFVCFIGVGLFFSVFRYVVICVAIVLFVCLFDGRLLYLENNVGKFLKKLVLRRWGSVTRSFGFIYLFMLLLENSDEYRYHRCVLNDDVTMVFVPTLFCKVLGEA